MSKIGNKPIAIPDGVNIKIDGQTVAASFGEKSAEIVLPREISGAIADNQINVSRINDSKTAKSLHGLYNRLVENLITGIKDGFNKELTFSGTGYRAALAGQELVLNMGYSHEIRLPIPEGLEVKVVKNTIVVSGSDKQRVGQFAAVIREVRPPEVYKGKGIKYKDEHIRRKAGKTAASK